MKSYSISLFIFVGSLILFFARPTFSSEDVKGQLISWSVLQMSQWSPPGKYGHKKLAESEEEGVSRYSSIAEDAISVAYDPAEKPLFSGKYGRAQTLAVLLSIAFHESNYMKDVDSGERLGDNGNSWCLMQIWLGKNSDKTKSAKNIELTSKYWEFSKGKDYGYGGEDLVRDRELCFRVALHMVRRSFDSCANKPIADRLAMYASGQGCDVGVEKSRIRINAAMRWLAVRKPPILDSSFLSTQSL